MSPKVLLRLHHVTWCLDFNRGALSVSAASGLIFWLLRPGRITLCAAAVGHGLPSLPVVIPEVLNSILARHLLRGAKATKLYIDRSRSSRAALSAPQARSWPCQVSVPRAPATGPSGLLLRSTELSRYRPGVRNDRALPSFLSPLPPRGRGPASVLKGSGSRDRVAPRRRREGYHQTGGSRRAPASNGFPPSAPQKSTVGRWSRAGNVIAALSVDA